MTLYLFIIAFFLMMEGMIPGKAFWAIAIILGSVEFIRDWLDWFPPAPKQ